MSKLKTDKTSHEIKLEEIWYGLEQLQYIRHLCMDSNARNVKFYSMWG